MIQERIKTYNNMKQYPAIETSQPDPAAIPGLPDSPCSTRTPAHKQNHPAAPRMRCSPWNSYSIDTPFPWVSIRFPLFIYIFSEPTNSRKNQPMSSNNEKLNREWWYTIWEKPLGAMVRKCFLRYGLVTPSLAHDTRSLIMPQPCFSLRLYTWGAELGRTGRVRPHPGATSPPTPALNKGKGTGIGRLRDNGRGCIGDVGGGLEKSQADSAQKSDKNAGRLRSLLCGMAGRPRHGHPPKCRYCLYCHVLSVLSVLSVPSSAVEASDDSEVMAEDLRASLLEGSWPQTFLP